MMFFYEDDDVIYFEKKKQNNNVFKIFLRILKKNYITFFEYIVV